MKFRSLLVAASMMALPVAAMAQPVDGLYVGAGFGYNWLFSQKIQEPTTNGSFTGSSGIVTLGSVGYGLGNGFRVEGEFNFRSTAQGGNGVGARNDTYGAFVNGLFDIDVGADFVYPYVGLGVGYVLQNMASANYSGESFSGTHGNVAGQLIAGASFPIPGVEGLSATAEGRLMGVAIGGASYGGDNGLSVKVGDQTNVSALVGLRYAFNVAPPPPPPAPVVAPAPAPARTYLVFFDWDKADLTERAKQIIAEAAANSAKVQVTRIEVSGFADRTGSAAYNLTLSRRRAENVAAQLVKDGVKKDLIEIFAFGDTKLLVPTGPGVREPQNRRVEIVFK